MQNTATEIPFLSRSADVSPGEHSDDLSVVISEISTLKQELQHLRKILDELHAIQSPLLDINQIAKAFGKSKDTIRRWTDERLISCFKIPNGKGHSYLFSIKQLEEDLEDFLQPKI